MRYHNFTTLESDMRRIFFEIVFSVGCVGGGDNEGGENRNGDSYWTVECC